MTTFDAIAARTQELPEVTRATSYGTPALKVGTRGRLLARLREDGETPVARIDPAERAPRRAIAAYEGAAG